MTSNHQGPCPAPFLSEETFPRTGGYIDGRFCQPFGNSSCCLPCPLTQWAYRDGFDGRTEVANWLNVAALIPVVFLLVSFAVLDVKWTHRHYLSICLAVGVIMMQVAFLIPLAAKPEQCHNAITPNGMDSSLTCAFSGAFLLAGGWSGVMWVFFRSLALHLQICWEIVPAVKFLYSSILLGWGIPAVGLAISLSLTGTSFRFGNVCHINHDKGIYDFWIPLLVFAGGALMLQLATLVYCIHVYIKSLLDDSTTTETSSHLPSYNDSVRTVTARQAYRRIRRVIRLQWRGILIVLIILADVVFFCVVFLDMDNSTASTASNIERAQPWLLCLVLQSGDKSQCLDKARSLVMNEATVLAVLVLLSLNGFWLLLLLGRWSMVLGWRDLFKRQFFRPSEFVSVDARRYSNDPRTYEMLSNTPQATPLKSPEPVVKSPGSVMSSRALSPVQGGAEPTDYFGRDAQYKVPTSSFSSPRPPSSHRQNQVGRDWDPSRTHAPPHSLPGIGFAKS